MFYVLSGLCVAHCFFLSFALLVCSMLLQALQCFWQDFPRVVVTSSRSVTRFYNVLHSMLLSVFILLFELPNLMVENGLNIKFPETVKKISIGKSK